MKKIAYLECPTGIAGDMCLGALIDLGVPLDYLIHQLNKLGIEDEYNLRVEKVDHHGQIATKFYVDLINHHHNSHFHRHLPEIQQLIQQANLPSLASDWSLNIFSQLAIAEGSVHGITPEKVHFHEVGAIDAIIDIVGTCLGLDWLGIDQLYCSSLPTGGGTVKAAHGILPVPVPAVLKLLASRQVSVYSNGIEQELVTPTGAAIAVTLATSFTSPPPLELIGVGLGAGTKKLPIPNILRLWLGNEIIHHQNILSQNSIVENIAVLETQIDDLNPQVIGYIFEELFQLGALDVFTQSIGMKKSRPGILLTVITPLEKVSLCEQVIFRETTTLGIRRLMQQRSILPREIQEIDTIYGKVRVKIAYQGNGVEKTIINVQPEYEDCVIIAKQHHLPWRLVHQLVLETFNHEHN